MSETPARPAMTARACFHEAMRFGRPERLPALEWATWWDKTLERWRGEDLNPVPAGVDRSQDGGSAGAPPVGELHTGAPHGSAPLLDAPLSAEPIPVAPIPGDLPNGDLHEAFGLDRHDQFWIESRAPDCPEPAFHGGPLITDRASFRALLPELFPAQLPAPGSIERAARIREERGSLLWMTLEGFFWFPRTLFGIEPHLYAFYDQGELMHELGDRLADWHLETIEGFCRIAVPDFMTFAEDLSYNLGPMISRECFEEFMTPYYRRVVPELKRRGIRIIIDSDGDISSAIPWFIDAGIEGALPLERQAGVDVAALRARFPDFLFIGGFDKMVMKHGEAAMRAEFERLLPAMRGGGFIPSVDHQTPPDVSLSNYRIYVRLLREYCATVGTRTDKNAGAGHPT